MKDHPFNDSPPPLKNVSKKIVEIEKKTQQRSWFMRQTSTLNYSEIIVVMALFKKVILHHN